MALRNPLDVLGFGAPRRGAFGSPAAQAPPMPGPGFSPLLGPAPGATPNALPPRFSMRDRASGFAQNHPLIADNSSMLLHMGLGLLSGGGNPNRSWAGAQQGALAGGQIDSQRRTTEAEALKEEEAMSEYRAVLAELGLPEDQRRVLEMVGPEGGLEFIAERLMQQPAGPEFGPIITGSEAQTLGLDPTKAYQQEANGEWHQVGGSGVNVTVPVTVGGEGTPFGDTVGEGLGQQFLDQRETALQATESLRSSQEARALLDGGMVVGPGADFIVTFSNFLKERLGWDVGGDAVANSQAFVATRAQEVGRMIQMFGAGTGLSDADREFATKAAAGQINMTEDAIRRILDINERAARNVIAAYNELAQQVPADLAPFPLLIEMPASPSAPTDTGAPADPNAVPEGVDPALWEAMTPQERALWQ